MRTIVVACFLAAVGALACSDPAGPGEPKTLGGRAVLVIEAGDSRLYSVSADGTNAYQLPIKLTGNLRQPDVDSSGIQLVFVRNFDLYIAHFVTGDATLLVADAGLDVAPDWSPDGQSVVFASTRTGMSDIYVAIPGGGTPQRLTSHEGREDSPRWSPDGSWIAFARMLDGRDELILIRPDGSGETHLVTPNGGNVPVWSPTGDRIAYVDGTFGGIRIRTVDGTSDQLLIEEPLITSLAWSPAGEDIAFVANGDAWLVNVNSGEIRPFFQTPSIESDIAWGPRSTPTLSFGGK